MVQQMTNLQNEAMQEFMALEEVTLPTQSVQAAIIFFYPFLQKYFVKRIFLGSLKG